MTSEEIKQSGFHYESTWLKEIAYQLAIKNEREATQALGWPIAAGQPWSNMFPLPSSNANVGSE